MIFKCKICGGELEIGEQENITVCQYCGTKQTLPKMDDEKRINMFDRANHFRRNNEYDKAMGIYETILNEDPTDAEAYWSLILCKYGVEYVEDPATHKWLPTCNRTLSTSVLADEDYKAAIQYASVVTAPIYKEEAEKIEEIQKEIMRISGKEDPYDIFICYKESDDSGRRTYDSVLAQDLYQQLTKEGYRVFFARISLEDKIGTAYEPYIFAALNSAKVMIAVGTKKEYFNAVWVRNEWFRFLGMMKKNPDKVLIPAYRDMDPYDLPDELLHLQAQDMGKIGFMQDLLHGIDKLLKQKMKESNGGENTKVVPIEANNVQNLIRRIEAFLEEGDIGKAKAYCEKVLDIKIDEARVYIAKLQIQLYEKYHENKFLLNQDAIYEVKNNLRKNFLFSNALKYADDEYKRKLEAIADKNKEEAYNEVLHELNKKIIEQNDVFRIISEFQGEEDNSRWEKLLSKAQILQKEYLANKKQLLDIRSEISDKEEEADCVRKEIQDRQVNTKKKKEEIDKKLYKAQKRYREVENEMLEKGNILGYQRKKFGKMVYHKESTQVICIGMWIICALMVVGLFGTGSNVFCIATFISFLLAISTNLAYNTYKKEHDEFLKVGFIDIQQLEKEMDILMHRKLDAKNDVDNFQRIYDSLRKKEVSESLEIQNFGKKLQDIEIQIKELKEQELKVLDCLEN
ncbi:MAG: TIR domain-containing protein [Lachnospiraceae bacterium]